MVFLLLPFAFFTFYFCDMDINTVIKEKLNAEWLPEIYRGKVRTQRTRAHRLEIAERENRAIIQHTLQEVRS